MVRAVRNCTCIDGDGIMKKPSYQRLHNGLLYVRKPRLANIVKDQTFNQVFIYYQ